jgi:hypothetical protein
MLANLGFVAAFMSRACDLAQALHPDLNLLFATTLASQHQVAFSSRL